MRPLRRRARQLRGSAGFTLVEMLVALILMSIVASLVLSNLLATSTSASSTTTHFNLTAEARVALNRIANDLGESTPLTTSGGAADIPAVTAVNNPDGPGYSASSVTSVTFNLDVSGDGCIDGVSSYNISPAQSASACSAAAHTPDPNQPESESICYDPGSRQLYLLAIDPTRTSESSPVLSCGGGLPLLAGNVSAFKIGYRSSGYLFQNRSGLDPVSGQTTWYDLDRAGSPVGNNNNTLDTPELLNVDTLDVSMTLSQGSHSQSFTTTVVLRNVHPLT